MTLLLAFLLSTSSSLALKVMIDPGHGGSDAGAYRDGLKESALTLSVAKKLAALLNTSKDFAVTLTRDSDVSLELKERVDLAVATGSELFLSIHANASTDSRARGAEFYFQNQLTADDSSSLAHHENQKSQDGQNPAHQVMNLSPFNADLRVALIDLLDRSRIRSSFELSRNLREQWKGQKKPKSTSLKQAPFHVVSRTPIPSSLIEIGFLTNSSDFSLLQSEDYLQLIAESIYEGLVAYKRGLATADTKKL